MLLFSTISYGQQAKGWLIYFGQTQIKDSPFSIHHEVQLRDHQMIGDFHQGLVRVGGQYRFNPHLQGTLGYGFIHTEQAGSPNLPIQEHRIYQELMVSTPIKSTSLRHRIRLEERFIENADFNGRFRYCLFADIPLTEKKFKQGGMYLAFYDEVFLNAVKPAEVDVFDRNRLYGGFGVKAKDNLGIQLGYMLQHIGPAKPGHHILLSFHHSMRIGGRR